MSICCVVRNLPEAGAALDIGSQVGIPDQFTLIVVPQKKIYSCGVVWRKDRRIGVRFVSQTKTRRREPAGLDPAAPLADAEIFRRLLAAVSDDFKADLGALSERSEASLFHCRDVNEHILATAIGLDKPIPLRRIEPLHSTRRHVSLSLKKTIVAVERRKGTWARKNPPADRRGLVLWWRE
jgi:hypothetical protein